MAPVGRTLLIVALLIGVYGIVASLHGARSASREWVDSGRRAIYALAGVTTVAWVILEAAFLRNDFSFNVVAAHSSTTTPTFYKLAAPWSSQEGSLLLWVWLMSLWSSLILFLTRRRVREIAPYATAILCAFGVFFTSLAAFFANPFGTTSHPPAEGAGLDPLLLHPSMMIHPPMLYSGYTLLGVGPGRERGADALAVHHRLHPLDHDPGEAGHAEGVERLAGPGQRHAGDPRDVPRALGDPRLDPRVRRLHAGRSLRGAAGGDDHRLDRAGGLPPRPAAQRGPAGLAAQPGGGVPAAEPGAGGDGVRDLLDHLLPADLPGDHGNQGVGRPAGLPALHRAARAGPGGAGGDRADHRLAPGDCREPAPQLPGPGGGGHRDRRGAGRPGGGGKAVRAGHVRPGRVRAGHGGPGAVARGRRAPGDDPGGRAGGAPAAHPAQPPTLRRLHRPRRDRGAPHRRGRLLLLPTLARRDPLAGRLGQPRRLQDQLRR